ncbi:FG-GAP repeat [Seminavis robusta]|uniref:Circumsporozoite protein n=1 Tax=Seminavis robusta TaxID=568900 RepID=A0A9N8H8K1_9STRA|nr:FG-GAP repeat [Seminavis robusta]|eukprot:Sro172_g075930.1 FG-GAP repeat (1330) ;mRNA; r:22785-27457
MIRRGFLSSVFVSNNDDDKSGAAVPDTSTLPLLTMEDSSSASSGSDDAGPVPVDSHAVDQASMEEGTRLLPLDERRPSHLTSASLGSMNMNMNMSMNSSSSKRRVSLSPFVMVRDDSTGQVFMDALEQPGSSNGSNGEGGGAEYRRRQRRKRRAERQRQQQEELEQQQQQQLEQQQEQEDLDASMDLAELGMAEQGIQVDADQADQAEQEDDEEPMFYATALSSSFSSLREDSNSSQSLLTNGTNFPPLVQPQPQRRQVSFRDSLTNNRSSSGRIIDVDDLIDLNSSASDLNVTTTVPLTPTQTPSVRFLDLLDTTTTTTLTPISMAPQETPSVRFLDAAPGDGDDDEEAPASTEEGQEDKTTKGNSTEFSSAEFSTSSSDENNKIDNDDDDQSDSIISDEPSVVDKATQMERTIMMSCGLAIFMLIGVKVFGKLMKCCNKNATEDLEAELVDEAVDNVALVHQESLKTLIVPVAPEQAATQTMAVQGAQGAANSTSSGITASAGGADGASKSLLSQLSSSSTTTQAAVAGGVAGVAGMAAVGAGLLLSPAAVGMMPSYYYSCGNVVAPDYQQGRVQMTIRGLDPFKMAERKSILEEIFVDAYNNASGMCGDYYQRILDTSIMESWNVHNEDDGGNLTASNNNATATITTVWSALVECQACPDLDPLFHVPDDEWQRRQLVEAALLVQDRSSNNNNNDTSLDNKNNTQVVDAVLYGYDHNNVDHNNNTSSYDSRPRTQLEFLQLFVGVFNTQLQERFRSSAIYIGVLEKTVVTTDAPSVAPSVMPSVAPSQAPSQQPSQRPSDQPSETPSNQPTGIPTNRPSMINRDTDFVLDFLQQITSEPTTSPSGTPSDSPSDTPTKAPTFPPTPLPTFEPTPLPSRAPTRNPTTTPSEQPSKVPTSAPTVSPSTSPSKAPTFPPTSPPTVTPGFPTAVPSSQPTLVPTTSMPTALPTKQPTSMPTALPTKQPTLAPTPTSTPSRMPSLVPTVAPSVAPSASPSSSPTSAPSASPSKSPTASPSHQPSSAPTTSPSSLPSKAPSPSPSSTPTSSPSDSPTVAPTKAPTEHPTRTPFSVVRFALVDADTNSYVSGYEDLQDGVVLDRGELPEQLTIEAICEPSQIGEVRFFIDGSQVRRETTVPYALGSDIDGTGNYRPSDKLEPDGEEHTLKAVPIWWFGLEGQSLEISFTVIRTTAPPTMTPTTAPSTTPFSVARFALVDADTNSYVSGYEDLQDGVVLDRGELPEQLTIEAICEPREIGEVLFFIDGSQVRRETSLPYALGSDVDGTGDYRPSSNLEPDGEEHTLKAVPIWRFGLEGQSLEIRFTVIQTTEPDE